MTTARVTPEGSSSFTGDVLELRSNSILLRTDHTLAFRTRARIEVGPATVDGEVVFAEDQRLAFTFPTTPEIFEAIEALDSIENTGDLPVSEPDVLAAIDEALASYVTAELRIIESVPRRPQPPQVEGGALDPGDPLDQLVWCLTLLSERPLVAQVTGSLQTPVKFRLPGAILELDATPTGAGWVGLRPRDLGAVRVVVQKMTDVFDDVVGAELPELGPDGHTVTFSARQLRQEQEDGTLTVRSAPLEIGEVRRLELRAPGQPDTSVQGIVIAVDEGEVTFSIEEEQTPQIAAPARVEVMTFDGPLDARRLVSDGPTNYFDVLSKALALRGRHVLEIEGGGRTVRLWTDDGRVAFTTAQPFEEGDRLGERLIATRRVTKHEVADALSAPRGGVPLGGVLLRDGRLSSVDLNRTLREQTIARVAMPVTMTRGRLSVAPWSEPPVEGRLLAVSPGGVRSALLRQVAAEHTTHELRDVFEAQAQGVLTVHLERIEPGYRLSDRAMRVVTNAARDEMTLDALLRSRGLKPAESATLALLGHALGFIEVGAAARAATNERTDTKTRDLEKRVERLAGADHFEVLEVHWAASHQEILAAYQRVTKQLEGRGASSPRAATLRAQLLERVESAYAVVGRRTSRERYRMENFSEDQRRRAAEHLIEQAELCVLRSDAENAELALDAAAELASLPQIQRLRHRCRSLREAAI